MLFLNIYFYHNFSNDFVIHYAKEKKMSILFSSVQCKTKLSIQYHVVIKSNNVTIQVVFFSQKYFLLILVNKFSIFDVCKRLDEYGYD
jgi:hypothetical protein